MTLRSVILGSAAMAALLSGSLFLSPYVLADDQESLTEKLEKAKSSVPQVEFELRYKFTPGETIKTQVVHVATTETKIKGNTQTSKSRAVSTKVWKIDAVHEDGSITFTHSVENVEMWQQVTDRPEVRYDSRTDEEAPPEYEGVQETIGVPLATITIDRLGNVVKREGGSQRQASLGLGDIAVPLPAGQVKLGHEWNAADEVFVRLANGQSKRINVRKHFTLDKVQTGVATISVRTQVLTPTQDPQILAQLAQQLTNGTIRFDVDAGRLLSRQMDWDETVVGFNGADSMLQYLARYTEELQEVTTGAKAKTAAKPAGPELRR
ncbi:MAG: hypothetical protein R3C99_16990 [Pirellulaceae bacterium]